MKSRLRKWLDTDAICSYIGLARNYLMPFVPGIVSCTLYNDADITDEEMEKLKEADRLLREVFESIAERSKEELDYLDKKIGE